jgi:phosphoglucomutase
MIEKTIPDAEILERARRYMEDEPEKSFRDEIQALCDKQARGDAGARAELRERFSSSLAFGTGGLRGIIGGGNNRLNLLAVRRATQGLADYMKRASGGNLTAVIAFDSRRFSERFALEAALVLSANGIKVSLFQHLQPTPVLSFMVRRLRACAGIVITASHNPPEYNGYKVSWSDGAQIVGTVAGEITAEIKKATGPIAVMEEGEAVERGLLERLPDSALEPYYAMVSSRLLRTQDLADRRQELAIVYTPLHGAGYVPVTTLFNRFGFKYAAVPEQSRPDGDFTYAPVPNPEFPSAFTLSFALAAKTKAGLILATDPDADRLGVAVSGRDGFTILSGNELGVLILDYIVETLAEKGRLPKQSYIVKSIVTSELQRRIAESQGVLCLDTLTGFKYICGVMRDMERDKPDCAFLLGNEESCGYLIETETRDKDGVSAAALVAEMGLYYKTRNKTLLDRLREIHARYGLFLDFQVAKTFAGRGGRESIRGLMAALRRDPGTLSPGARVSKVKDYLAGTTTEAETGRSRKDIDLPPSDVLQMFLEDGGLLTARPSGTEPKIKFYASLHVDPPFDEKRAAAELAARGGEIRRRIDEFVERNAQ